MSSFKSGPFMASQPMRVPIHTCCFTRLPRNFWELRHLHRCTRVLDTRPVCGVCVPTIGKSAVSTHSRPPDTTIGVPPPTGVYQPHIHRRPRWIRFCVSLVYQSSLMAWIPGKNTKAYQPHPIGCGFIYMNKLWWMLTFTLDVPSLIIKYNSTYNVGNNIKL